MKSAGTAGSQRKSVFTVAAALSAVAVGCFLAAEPAQANTLIWSNGNDAGAAPGPVIQEFDAVTGARLTAFADPAATSANQVGRGIAVVGSNIFYSLGGSTSVFLTNPSGANLGTAFVVNIPGVTGVQSIASDGKFLYITPQSSNLSLVQNVYKFSFSGTLIGSPITMVGSGGIVQSARDGLEIVGNTFVANQPRGDIGPYDQFDATTGSLITPAFLNPGTFGFTGVAFDGTDYFVFDDEADPSQLVVFDAAGTFLHRVTLTGLPGPNDQAFLSDLSAVVPGAVGEPPILALFAAGLFGFALSRRRRVPSAVWIKRR
jgi:hypothetical protein